MFLQLLLMSSSNSDEAIVNLAILLKENKDSKILSSEEYEKRISYLRQFPASLDDACENLRSNLLKSLATREFIIPD
jgi:ABC-type iron transport system FetAB ATPase subunit